MTGSNDPMEGMIRAALKRAGIRFVEGDRNPARLDFHLPEFALYIEVKQFHSDRIAAQMARADNVIVAQGRGAVEALAAMIEAGALGRLRSRPPGNESGSELGITQAAGAGLNPTRL